MHEAIRAGAKYCITDKKLSKSSSNKNILLVENIQKFLLDLSKIKRSLYKGNVIGITGSAGKTSLKEYLKYYLSKNLKFPSIKSYNNNLGVMISILNLNLNLIMQYLKLEQIIFWN